MNRKKVKPLMGTDREKLLVALVAEDVVNILNTVCKARGLSFQIDYTKPSPCLYISRPGVDREVLMTADARTKKCAIFLPKNEELLSAVTDLFDRLRRVEASLLLLVQKDRTGKRWAKLQIMIEGSRTIALTILDVNRGQKISDNSFCLPGDDNK